jgi:hypothetical protein
MAITTKNTNIQLEYIAETNRGVPVSSGTLLRPSDAIRNITLTGVNNAGIQYSINDYDGIGTTTGLRDFTLSFEYDLQRHSNANSKVTLKTGIQYYAQYRSSGVMTPLTFYLHTDSNSTWVCKGSIINTFSVNVDPTANTIPVTVECSVATAAMEAGSYASLTSSVANATTFETPQGSSVTRSGSLEEGAGSFTLTINNKAAPQPIIGSSTASKFESVENLSGTVDLLLVSGGNTDWEELRACTEADIVFSSGTSTTATDKSMKWTFSDGSYTNFPVNLTPETTVVISGVNWIAETVTLAAYS